MPRGVNWSIWRIKSGESERDTFGDRRTERQTVRSDSNNQHWIGHNCVKSAFVWVSNIFVEALITKTVIVVWNYNRKHRSSIEYLDKRYLYVNVVLDFYCGLNNWKLGKGKKNSKNKSNTFSEFVVRVARKRSHALTHMICAKQFWDLKFNCYPKGIDLKMMMKKNILGSKCMVLFYNLTPGVRVSVVKLRYALRNRYRKQ